MSDYDPKIVGVANASNAETIKALQNLQPIRYDGLNCPECGSFTVESTGFLWCPNIGCGWGNELKLPTLITKWAVKQ